MEDITFAQFLSGCNLTELELSKGNWFRISKPVIKKEVKPIIRITELSADMEIYLSGKRCGKTHNSNIV